VISTKLRQNSTKEKYQQMSTFLGWYGWQYDDKLWYFGAGAALRASALFCGATHVLSN